MVNRLALLLAAVPALASADPAPASPPPAKVAPRSAVVSSVITQSPAALPDPPPKQPAPRSLRDEAARAASDVVAGGQASRDPDLLLMPWQVGRWRSGRAGKLEAAAAGATFVGEAALGLGGSPIAVLGLFAAGATLDAAASDIEAVNPPAPAPKPKRIKHKLR